MDNLVGGRAEIVTVLLGTSEPQDWQIERDTIAANRSYRLTLTLAPPEHNVYAIPPIHSEQPVGDANHPADAGLASELHPRWQERQVLALAGRPMAKGLAA